MLALDPVEPAGGSAHGTATILAGGGRARFTVRGLKPSANGGFYELWLMNSADDLVSLGSFRVPASGKAVVTVPLPADPDGFAALDISAEPADGNPAHSATLGAARAAEAELNETGPPPAGVPAAARVLRGSRCYLVRKSTSSSLTRSDSSWWTQCDALGRRSTRSRLGTSSWCGSASLRPR